MIVVTWSLGPTKMIVLLCYMVPSDQIVPFVSNSFLTYQAIYKSSHLIELSMAALVLYPMIVWFFPYFHIGPNGHIRPNYRIGLECHVGLDNTFGPIDNYSIRPDYRIGPDYHIGLNHLIESIHPSRRMPPFYITELNVIGPIWSRIRPQSLYIRPLDLVLWAHRVLWNDKLSHIVLCDSSHPWNHVIFAEVHWWLNLLRFPSELLLCSQHPHRIMLRLSHWKNDSTCSVPIRELGPKVPSIISWKGVK